MKQTYYWQTDEDVQRAIEFEKDLKESFIELINNIPEDVINATQKDYIKNKIVEENKQ